MSLFPFPVRDAEHPQGQCCVVQLCTFHMCTQLDHACTAARGLRSLHALGKDAVTLEPRTKLCLDSQEILSNTVLLAALGMQCRWSPTRSELKWLSRSSRALCWFALFGVVNVFQTFLPCKKHLAHVFLSWKWNASWLPAVSWCKLMAKTELVLAVAY